MGLIKYFFCLNSRGVPVVVRTFLAEASQTVVETFFAAVQEDPSPPAVFSLENLNFAYVTIHGLYFVLATEDSMSPAVLLELLGRLILVIGDYLGSCSEMKMLRSLALVYEIVDEVLSFGCPQATDASNLMHLVHNTVQYDAGFLKDIDLLDVLEIRAFDRPLALSPEDRRRSTPEIFLILNESIEMVLTASNHVLRTLITGTGIVKNFLDGQPTIRLQFDPQMCVTTRSMSKYDLIYDDIAFASLVQSQSFDSDRSIQFVPPQGLMKVFTYRCSRPVNPPFTITNVFENLQAKVVVARLSIQSNFAAEIEADDVTVRFQCPVEISSGSCEVAGGVGSSQTGEFDANNRQILWRIKKFSGLKEFSARFRFMFDAGIQCAAETLLGPVALQFAVRELLPTGASIRSFEVSGSAGTTPPKRWLKTMATAECYTFNFI